MCIPIASGNSRFSSVENRSEQRSTYMYLINYNVLQSSQLGELESGLLQAYGQLKEDAHLAGMF
jgi:hypothetical protein